MRLIGRRDLLPAGLQRGADGGELFVGGGGEAGEDEDRRVDVERPLLAAGIQAATAVEDAAGVYRQGHGGDGVEQGLHGDVSSVSGLWPFLGKRKQLLF